MSVKAQFKRGQSEVKDGSLKHMRKLSEKQTMRNQMLYPYAQSAQITDISNRKAQKSGPRMGGHSQAGLQQKQLASSQSQEEGNQTAVRRIDSDGSEAVTSNQLQIQSFKARQLSAKAHPNQVVHASVNLESPEKDLNREFTTDEKPNHTGSPRLFSKPKMPQIFKTNQTATKKKSSQTVYKAEQDSPISQHSLQLKMHRAVPKEKNSSVQLGDKFNRTQKLAVQQLRQIWLDPQHQKSQRVIQDKRPSNQGPYNMDTPIELASQEEETPRRSKSPGYAAVQADFFDEMVTPQQVKPVLGSKNRRKMLNPTELPVMPNRLNVDNQTPAFVGAESKRGPSMEAVRQSKDFANEQHLKQQRNYIIRSQQNFQKEASHTQSQALKQILTKVDEGLQDIDFIQENQAMAGQNQESMTHRGSSQTHLHQPGKVIGHESGNQIMINTGPVTAHTVLLNLVPASVPAKQNHQNLAFSQGTESTTNTHPTGLGGRRLASSKTSIEQAVPASKSVKRSKDIINVPLPTSQLKKYPFQGRRAIKVKNLSEKPLHLPSEPQQVSTETRPDPSKSSQQDSTSKRASKTTRGKTSQGTKRPMQSAKQSAVSVTKIASNSDVKYDFNLDVINTNHQQNLRTLDPSQFRQKDLNQPVDAQNDAHISPVNNLKGQVEYCLEKLEQLQQSNHTIQPRSTDTSPKTIRAILNTVSKSAAKTTGKRLVRKSINASQASDVSASRNQDSGLKKQGSQTPQYNIALQAAMQHTIQIQQSYIAQLERELRQRISSSPLSQGRVQTRSEPFSQPHELQKRSLYMNSCQLQYKQMHISFHLDLSFKGTAQAKSNKNYQQTFNTLQNSLDNFGSSNARYLQKLELLATTHDLQVEEDLQAKTPQDADMSVETISEE